MSPVATRARISYLPMRTPLGGGLDGMTEPCAWTGKATFGMRKRLWIRRQYADCSHCTEGTSTKCPIALLAMKRRRRCWSSFATCTKYHYGVQNLARFLLTAGTLGFNIASISLHSFSVFFP